VIFATAPLSFVKQQHSIEVFRSYTDCLYSAYGTKWNGNAAAYNGSLFVLQNNRLRRLTPLECERLMGFPDNYTDIAGASATARYQGIGNSWAVPVIKWLGMRLIDHATKDSKLGAPFHIDLLQFSLSARRINFCNQSVGIDFSGAAINIGDGRMINCSEKPLNNILGNIFEVIDVEAAEKFYITPAGCKGILRRKEERKLSMNNRLEEVLREISSEWSSEKIELISRKQSRGRFSTSLPVKNIEERFSYSLF
jgi:DNA (cytosine-5)-methyltransferase 1